MLFFLIEKNSINSFLFFFLIKKRCNGQRYGSKKLGPYQLVKIERRGPFVLSHSTPDGLAI